MAPPRPIFPPRPASPIPQAPVGARDPLAEAEALLARGDAAGARDRLETLLRSRPRDLNVRALFARAALRTGDHAAAEKALRAAVRQAPDAGRLWFELANVLAAARKYDEAIKAYRRAQATMGTAPELLGNLGNALLLAQRYAEAREAFERALVLRPDMALLHLGLGRALIGLGRPCLVPAWEAFERAAELDPNLVDAHLRCAGCLTTLGRIAESLAAYDRALELQPEHPHARYFRGMLLIRHADPMGPQMVEGLKGLEGRIPTVAELPRPLFDGSDFDGRTLLVSGESGLGDTLQFARYLPLIGARAKRIVLRVHKPLVELMRRNGMAKEVIGFGDPLPQTDGCVPIMSLPYRLGLRGAALYQTDAVPYLAADPVRIAAWRERLGPSPSLRVGIVWKGSQANNMDLERSIPLQEFAALAAVPGVELISLQKHDGLEQLAAWQGSGRPRDLGPDLDRDAAYLDTMAVLAQIDLLVSCDSSPVHVAGAMDRPVWVALTYDSDWRWFVERSDTPWYPSLRLYRQQTDGDWAGVFKAMAADLADLARRKQTERAS